VAVHLRRMVAIMTAANLHSIRRNPSQALLALWICRRVLAVTSPLPCFHARLPACLPLCLPVCFAALHCGASGHRVQHESKFLWRLHSKHHAIDTPSPFSTLFIDPTDAALQVRGQSTATGNSKVPFGSTV
jgi:sterol desaturase/sphingolipid hydroxylase (fatty acid hydroxylase superfamily)